MAPIYSETISPFTRLKSSFKVLTALMEGNCDEDELQFVEKNFDQQQGYYTKKVCETTNQLDSLSSLNFVTFNTQS